MANYKVKGIILKRTNFGEADRLLTIFTDKLGKIKAIAKGVRKQNSRKAGHLEPFCFVALVIAEGRNLDIITEAETIECFFSLRNNLHSTNLTYYISEAVDKMTVEHEKHDEVFELLLDTLKNINKINDDYLLTIFELKLISSLGFKPELDKCVKCHKKLNSTNYFDFAEGGIICQDCPISGVPISQNSIKLLRIILTKNFTDLKKISIDSDTQKQTQGVTQGYIDYISQHEFKSRRFLNN